jgi:hypothetical protein
MGGDWLLIANIAFMGKTKILPGVSVHRELGGATASYRQIAKSLSLPKVQATFPMVSVAASAWADISVRQDTVYRSQAQLTRLVVATIVFLVIISKSVIALPRAVARQIHKLFVVVVNGG